MCCYSTFIEAHFARRFQCLCDCILWCVLENSFIEKNFIDGKSPDGWLLDECGKLEKWFSFHFMHHFFTFFFFPNFKQCWVLVVLRSTFECILENDNRNIIIDLRCNNSSESLAKISIFDADVLFFSTFVYSPTEWCFFTASIEWATELYVNIDATMPLYNVQNHFHLDRYISPSKW